MVKIRFYVLAHRPWETLERILDPVSVGWVRGRKSSKLTKLVIVLESAKELSVSKQPCRKS